MELLSPAGSPIALRSAVQNGADAVYLGVKSFSARMGAANFTEDELAEAVRYCRIRDVKVYLAVNTIFFDKELPFLEKLAFFAADVGVDACIVQDLGAARVIRHTAPDMKLHASTQMTVHSLEGVRFLEREGFRRVVLARELERSEIKEICENSQAEIEIFVHGALCIGYSGKCLMSSMIGGRSGNRGKCAQPCRLPFTAGGEKGFLLSPKDLCLIDDLAELARFPVASFKIEGRMKSPEYVAVVTAAYRRAIDDGAVAPGDREKLKNIFCRGGDFTRAYYGGIKVESMMNTRVSNDNVGKRVSEDLLKEAARTYAPAAEFKKVPVDISFYKSGDNAVLEMQKGEARASATCPIGNEPPVAAERVKNQLEKLGQTPFFRRNISVSEDIGIKISQINEMRRNCCAKLEDCICERREKKVVYPYKYSEKVYRAKTGMEICVQVTSIEQAEAVAGKVDEIYVPIDFCNYFEKLSSKSRIYALLPVIIKGWKQKLLRDIKRAQAAGAAGVVCGSLDALEAVRGQACEIVGGIGLNVSNSESVRHLEEWGLRRIAVSPELSLKQIREMTERTKVLTEAVIYGRLPLMITENRFERYENGITDRTGAVFPVWANGGHGSVIYNSRPLYLADKDYSGPSRGIMLFTIEGATECVDILKKYKNAVPAEFPFTRGYFE